MTITIVVERSFGSPTRYVLRSDLGRIVQEDLSQTPEDSQVQVKFVASVKTKKAMIQCGRLTINIGVLADTRVNAWRVPVPTAKSKVCKGDSLQQKSFNVPVLARRQE
jgi:hypothetical protein